MIEWVCLCLWGGLVLCNFVLGEVWRQRDGRDVTSECITRDMRSERARPLFAKFTICTGHSCYCYKRIPVPGVLCHRLTELTELPGKGTGFLQNFQKFRVRVRMSYRTSRSSRYCGTGVQNSQKFRACIKILYPYPGYCGHRRAELPEVSGTGMNVVQNFQKFRVRV